MKLNLALFLGAVLTLGYWNDSVADRPGAHAGAYTFSVAPYRPVPKLEADFSPFLAHLHDNVDLALSLKLALNSLKYFELLREQIPDVALVNPFDSVPAQDEFGYRPVLARPPHRCKILALKDGPIRSVTDLRQRRVGFASKRSPLSFYSEKALKTQGLEAEKDYQKLNYSSPFSCLHNLVIGSVDACAAGQRTAASYKVNRNIELIELAQCEAFPGMVFMAHERVPQAHVETITAQFLDWQSKKSRDPGNKHRDFGRYDAAAYETIRNDYKQWLNAK